MMGFVMFLHGMACVFLLIVILMQSGRGGGLTEGFASAESMFGAQTNEFMIKATTVLATLFFITCIGLAVLSSQRGKSLMSNRVATQTEQSADLETVSQAVDNAPQAMDIQIGDEEARTKAAPEVQAVEEAVEQAVPASN